MDIFGLTLIVLLTVVILIALAYLVAFVLGRKEDRDTYRRGGKPGRIGG